MLTSKLPELESRGTSAAILETAGSAADRGLISILEYFPAEPVRVDRDAGIIRGVKVLGLASANGRRYTKAAIARAVPLYAGVKVNIDHPLQASDSSRRLSDRFGKLENVKETETGLYADLHYLRSHPLADFAAEAAERMPEALGLSHHALGRMVKQGRELIVEEIVQVKSVDLVSDPATTSSLFEQVQAEHASRGPSAPEAPLGTESTSHAATLQKVEALLTRVRCLEQREQARGMLLQAGLPMEPSWIDVLAELTETQAQAQIGQWQRNRPARNGDAPRSQSREQLERTSAAARLTQADDGTIAAFLRGKS